MLSMTMRVMAIEDVLDHQADGDLGAPPAVRGPDRDRPGAARAHRLAARPRRHRLVALRPRVLRHGRGARASSRSAMMRRDPVQPGTERPRRHRCRFGRRRSRVAATHGRTIDDARAAPPPRGAAPRARQGPLDLLQPRPERVRDAGRHGPPRSTRSSPPRPTRSRRPTASSTTSAPRCARTSSACGRCSRAPTSRRTGPTASRSTRAARRTCSRSCGSRIRSSRARSSTTTRASSR